MGTRLSSLVRLGLLTSAILTCAAAFAGPDASATPAAAPAREAGFVSGMDVSRKAAADAPAVADTGMRAGDPYRAMIDDMLAAPRQGRTPDAAATAHDSSTLFYDEKELEARAASFKAELSAILGDDTPAEQSAEERELALKKEIAMRSAYADGAAGGGRGHGSQQGDDTGRIRMIELAFLMWDILTHPATLSLIALYGLARLAIAILRVAKDPHGRKSRHRRGNRAPATLARQAEPTPNRAADAKIAEPRRRSHRSSRRRRSRGRFFDRFRSI